jgi:hypothetical protein
MGDGVKGATAERHATVMAGQPAAVGHSRTACGAGEGNDVRESQRLAAATSAGSAHPHAGDAGEDAAGGGRRQALPHAALSGPQGGRAAARRDDAKASGSLSGAAADSECTSSGIRAGARVARRERRACIPLATEEGLQHAASSKQQAAVKATEAWSVTSPPPR